MSQKDIRIGTLVSMSQGANYIQQILPHGFESFSLTFWQKIDADMAKVAPEILATIGDKAVISSIGFFGNPLQNPDHVKGLEECIDKAHLFGASLVCGFAGALDLVNMVIRLLAEKFRDLDAKFAKAAVAFDQFLADVLVLAGLDEFAHRLAQALDRQRDIVLHEFGAADAQFLPFAPAGGAALAAGIF